MAQICVSAENRLFVRRLLFGCGFTDYLSLVFFNSEEAQSTTWLHPVSGEAVVTGHRKTPGNDVSSTLLYKSAKARARG